MSKIKTFLSRRKTKYPEEVFKRVCEYFIYCHNKLLTDGIKYSKSYIKFNTKIKPENYYRNKFLEEYLQANINKDKFPIVKELLFFPEVQVLYVNSSQEAEANVDIYVTNFNKYVMTKLPTEQIYFNYECKRLNNISLNQEYLTNGVSRYLRRDNKKLFRFTGMIGFVEEGFIPSIVKDINEKLGKDNNSITTKQTLKNITLVKGFSYSYLSVHVSIVKRKVLFYHLFFDLKSVLID